MMTKPSDNTNYTSSEHTIARITFNSTKHAYVTINSPSIPIVIGMRVADSAALMGDCVQPINTKAIAVIAGISAIRLNTHTLKVRGTTIALMAQVELPLKAIQ
jgi:hypothetical protein